MADKPKQPLFNEFPPVATQTWMDKIKADLKGADFDKKLVWKTSEGFNVNPFYRQEDLEQLDYLTPPPGEFPFVRGTTTSNGWLVRQDIIVNDPADANSKALSLLNKGVDSLAFIIEKEELVSAPNIKTLLAGLPLTQVEINFKTCQGNKKLLQLFGEELKARNIEADDVKGSLDHDPLGKLATGEKICDPVEKAMDYLASIVVEAKAMPSFQVVSVNGRNFQNAGATSVQELAFSLSAGNEYLSQLTGRGIPVDIAASAIKFNLGIGSNYFMEIAKLRAARLLWATIVNEYKPLNKKSCKMVVHCETSEFNQTIFDPYVNLLRTQTEAMSATIGGCHSLTLHPFDAIFREPSEFSERIARNQQLLLKEESYFDKVVDPAGGSYYIENLTANLATESWELFRTIEEQGGFLSALKAGAVQARISEAATRRRKDLASRREVLLGTNQYPNFTETMADSITKGVETKNIVPVQGVEPIKLDRAAQEFETLRLATESASKTPVVFMLTYGNLGMRLARSQFSSNFFGCAGYKIVDNLGFATIEEGVKAALAERADIVVLCSSDEEYAEAALVALEKLGGKAILVIAGAPACADELKAKGVEHFISLKSNVLETLQQFNKLLNINRANR